MKARLYPTTLRALAFCLVALASGCAVPTAPSEYLQWEAPESIQGQRCVSACEADRWRCRVRNDEELSRCQVRANYGQRRCESAAAGRKQVCLDRVRVIHGEKWRDFTASCQVAAGGCVLEVCDLGKTCGAKYETCFLGCGGQVQKRLPEFSNVSIPKQTN